MSVFDGIPTPSPITEVEANIKTSAAADALMQRMSSGRSYARLYVKGLDQSRFGIRLMSDTETVNPQKSIPLKIANRKEPVIVNIASLCRRLLLTEEEVREAASKHKLEELVQARASELSHGTEVLEPYELVVGGAVKHKSGETVALSARTLIAAGKAFQAFKAQGKEGIGELNIYNQKFKAIKTGTASALILEDRDKKLGEGSFGTLYKVFNVTQGVFQAYKVAKLDRAASTIQEFETLRAIHKNRVLEGVQAPPHLLVTQNGEVGYLGRLYHGDCENWALEDQPAMKRLGVCKKIASSFSEFLTANYWHRDIKPANFLMTKEGDPVLADFGSSAPLFPATDAAMKDFSEVDSGMTSFYIHPVGLKKQLDIASLGRTALKQVEILKLDKESITDCEARIKASRENGRLSEIPALEKELGELKAEFQKNQNSFGTIEKLQRDANGYRDQIHRLGQFLDFHSLFLTLTEVIQVSKEQLELLTPEESEKYGKLRQIISEMGDVSMEAFQPASSFQLVYQKLNSL